jgi:hypothetical protein
MPTAHMTDQRALPPSRAPDGRVCDFISIAVPP